MLNICLFWGMSCLCYTLLLRNELESECPILSYFYVRNLATSDVTYLFLKRSLYQTLDYELNNVCNAT